MHDTDTLKHHTPLLSCRNLSVTFHLDGIAGHAVRGVDFDVLPKRTLGIVGESGCGKSVTALSILGLLPKPPALINSGSILFNNKDLILLPLKELQSVRGKSISMIFQDPMTSLNPVLTCGSQIIEALQAHSTITNKEALTISQSLLEQVGIRESRRVLSQYPHQLSGGMLQRIMIAIALSCSPQLLIADEPTTALDVTVQARILDLLQYLQSTRDMSMILITHDLGVVSDIAHDIIVMYAGLVVEQATAQNLFDEPLHPYTQALFETLPDIAARKKRLAVIPGEVPNPQTLPAGCPFHPRCTRCMEKCKTDMPALTKKSDTRAVRCFLYE
jgi:oligopeptide/dipeptide ABC transporter ATP-binding protein